MSENQTERLLMKVTDLEKLGEEVSFLQIGRNKYMVSLVGQDMSIVDELKTYVASEVATVKEELSNVFEGDIAQQLAAQINHIQSARRRGQVAIPMNMQNKPVKYLRNEVLEVKPFVFNPWCIKSTYDDILAIAWSIEANSFLDSEAVAKMDRARARDGEWQLTFRSEIMFPGLVCLSQGQLQMVNELKTFHTYDSGNMCTGNSDARAVFALAPTALGVQLSILNRFSPLSSHIRWGTTRLEFPNWLSKCEGFAISRNAVRTSEELAQAVSAPTQEGWRV